MKALLESFGLGTLGALILVGAAAFYILPAWFLVQFAKRERKDWRVALVSCLLFTWLFAWLIVLIVPKLSDEDHERINGKVEPVQKSFRVSGVKLPKADLSGMNADDWFKPVLWGLGICAAGVGGMIAFFSWAI